MQPTMIRVDAMLRKEADVKHRAIDAGLVRGAMDGSRNRRNVVVLDACHDTAAGVSWKTRRTPRLPG